MPKTAIAQHLLPTDDLRKQLDEKVGGLTISLKNRGLDWLFYDLDGKTIVAHYFPAQSLLNVHAEGSARPTFQGNGIGPDEIADVLAKHLDTDHELVLRYGVPVISDLSDCQREILYRFVAALAGNSAHAKTPPATLVSRARELMIEAINTKLHDDSMVEE